MSDNECLTAEQAMAGGRKKIKLSTGKHIEICRLTMAKFVEVCGSIPDVSALKKMQAKPEVAITSTRGIEMMKIVEDVVRAGVVRPELHDDPRKGPTPRDFSTTDQNTIFAEILKLTGATEKEGAEIIPLQRTSD